MRELFNNRSLRRVLFAFASLNLAELAFVTALAIHVYRDSGTLALGLVGFRFLPAAVSGLLLAGAIDRRFGRRTLPDVAAVRTVLMALGALCVAADVALPVVIAVVVLDAVASAADGSVAVMVAQTRCPRAVRRPGLS